MSDERDDQFVPSPPHDEDAEPAPEPTKPTGPLDPGVIRDPFAPAAPTKPVSPPPAAEQRPPADPFAPAATHPTRPSYPPAPPAYPPAQAPRELQVPEYQQAAPGPYDPPAAPVYKPRIQTNVMLFLLTLASSIYWGFLQYQQFYSEELRGIITSNPFRAPEALLGGLPFGIAVIAILLAHEMGHYLACRYYKIAATLPYFIPLPPPNIFPTLLPGTMGAVIRIRGAITSRRALFDIAVAGPIAGWVTALPILAYGLSQSKVVDRVVIETSGGYFTLGEPLIWPLLSGTFGPEVSASQDLVMHPLAFVGWFALLITSMNLLPVGQLDGGHLMYTLVPKLHRPLSFAVLAFMLYAGFAYFLGWIVFAVVVSALFMVGGMRHPKPINHTQSLGAARIVLMLVALAIFVTSFMLVPVTLPTVAFR